MGDLTYHNLWPPSINSLRYIHEEAFNFEALAFAIQKTPSITQNPPCYNTNNYQGQSGTQQQLGTPTQDNKRQNNFFSRNDQQNKQARSGQQVGICSPTIRLMKLSEKSSRAVYFVQPGAVQTITLLPMHSSGAKPEQPLSQ